MANSFDKIFVVVRNQYDGDADEVLDYFEDTYISRFRRNASRRPPLFPSELWNMFHGNTEELPRTNNNTEARRNTPCLRTPAESTPESYPVKMRPTKSVPGEESLDFLPPRCILVIWVTLREILNC